ncbi:signal peptidase, endoplasmic reticulum-type [Haloplanus vescus]|uniref:Signal peptidase, endoplasmic reticulum-type n=1 Tax=Haloplanus vescus TaxID=555874 RepID=A0A1H3Z2K1_9EURY|nr:S26 family signal peptidase [Haloplanus vescus]SEA17955.1 signal peptidase, endoplasmic reticulum-type [Haloplanus vescus]
MSSDDGSRSPDERPSDSGFGDGDAVETERSGDGEEPAGPIRRVATATDGLLLVVRETTLSVGAVVAIGLLLFAISGVWPPMVAVESGSMEPHMQKGDLVFITDTGRFTPDAAHNDTGVVTRDAARETGYWKFGAHGSVVVYDNPTRGGPPVIHRAQFWVSEGENWYDRANPEYVTAPDCDAMPNCPAPNAGFVTKGDANGQYDQVNGISEPVKPEWIVGVARVRIPYLGWVRLGVSSLVLDTTPMVTVDDGRAAVGGPTAA